MLLGVDQRPCGLDCRGDQGSQRDVVLLQLQAPAGDPGDIQKVFQQQRHALHLAAYDFAAPLALALVGAWRLEQLHRMPDGREGIAQLVRQRCEKLIFATVGIPQSPLGRLANGHLGSQGCVGLLEGARPGLHLVQHAVEGRDHQPDLIASLGLRPERVVASLDDLPRDSGHRTERLCDASLQGRRQQQRHEQAQERDQREYAQIGLEPARDVVARAQVDRAEQLAVANDGLRELHVFAGNVCANGHGR